MLFGKPGYRKRKMGWGGVGSKFYFSVLFSECVLKNLEIDKTDREWGGVRVGRGRGGSGVEVGWGSASFCKKILGLDGVGGEGGGEAIKKKEILQAQLLVQVLPPQVQQQLLPHLQVLAQAPPAQQTRAIKTRT